MDDFNQILDLFGLFKEAYLKAAPDKKQMALKKLESSLKSCLTILQPKVKKNNNQSYLKEQLLVNQSAMQIRRLWENHKKIINLKALAEEAGITLKKPTIEHVILSYYQPEDRLQKLVDKLEIIGSQDTDFLQRRSFLDWRGELRAKGTIEEVASGIKELFKKEGIETIRKFAAHLGVKDSSGKRKLPKSASEQKLLQSLATHLWNEKMTSRAQEGLL